MYDVTLNLDQLSRELLTEIFRKMREDAAWVDGRFITVDIIFNILTKKFPSLILVTSNLDDDIDIKSLADMKIAYTFKFEDEGEATLFMLEYVK